jgi:hypothetical protein
MILVNLNLLIDFNNCIKNNQNIVMNLEKYYFLLYADVANLNSIVLSKEQISNFIQSTLYDRSTQQYYIIDNKIQIHSLIPFENYN